MRDVSFERDMCSRDAIAVGYVVCGGVVYKPCARSLCVVATKRGMRRVVGRIRAFERGSRRLYVFEPDFDIDIEPLRGFDLQVLKRLIAFMLA